MAATTASHSAPAMQDPLDALRRRKRELEQADTPVAPALQPPVDQPAVHQTPVQSAPSVTPALPSDGLDRLTSKLDEQFSRLSQAVGDVRQIAEASAADQAGLRETVANLQSRIDDPHVGQRSYDQHDDASAGPSLNDLSTQIRAVQDAISAMPKPEAIQSLEEGYHHVLERLDTLKSEGTPDIKIDALYGEVTSLRELLDGLNQSQKDNQNQGDTPALMEEMRAMIARLESEPSAGADRITEALEAVKGMAQGAAHGTTPAADPAFINEAIGAVVERLVALEARIEALASGADDSHVTARLDAIQSEMERLSTFQDEARGLTSALDTIRDELRASTPTVDRSGMDERFSALDRIEQMTGGYAHQVATLSERLNALDGAFANQGDIVSEVASLSRQLGELQSTLPIHEIEQTLLDLTGRVTALQEDTSAERLGLAVRELGERVESCLKSIPRTQSIIQAVEEKIDSRFVGVVEPMLTRLDTVDARLDGIQKAISEADAPLIENMSHRLEGLIAAMPMPRADEALASLEAQLEELTARTSTADMVSREDVMRLNNELARARASVELGSNRDLQRAIVDQVRHLADRFDQARISGDASLLPEISQQIEGLAGRVQALGLFNDEMPAGSSSPAVDSMQNALQSELVSLRESANDQDQRMHSTLESVQTALETVIRRLNALESDDKAAAKLAEDNALAQGGQPHSLEQVQRALMGKSPAPDPIPTQADTHTPYPSGSQAQSAPGAPAETPKDIGPEAGDAQTLLRQLSGAMGGVNPDPVMPSSPLPNSSLADTNLLEANQAEPIQTEPSLAEPGLPERTPTAPQALDARAARASRRQARNAGTRAGGKASAEAGSDAASQRASFIAAARRAAQAAALQASGGNPAAAASLRGAGVPAPVESERREPTIAEVLAGASAHEASTISDALEDTQAKRTPLEKVLAGDAPHAPNAHQAPEGEPSGDDDTKLTQTRTDDSAFSEPHIKPQTAIEELGATAKTVRKEQTERKQKEEKRQNVLSRAMLIALVLFTVGLGLFVVNLILPDSRSANGVIAPASTIDTSAEADVSVAEPARDSDLASVPPATDVRAVGPDAGLDDMALTESAASSNPDDGLEAGFDATPATGVEEAALGAGFERDRGPVMAETPDAAETQNAAALPPPANDLGPLLNPPLPTLPQSNADALPEAIGSPRLRVAAAGGDAAAAFEVATRFMEGRFVPQDLTAAAHWYGRAADQGVIPAAYRLGSFYEQGRGVDRDPQGAIAWYERAALGGNPRAMHNLAVMAAEGPDGGAPDFARAAGWFIPAANRGLADSQFNLAVLFARGMGVERDLMESYKWFALAAAAGDTEAVARRDEVAGVLGEQALALANARVDNWVPVEVDSAAVTMSGPEGGWDDAPTSAGASDGPSQSLVAEAQSLLSQRGYDPGPADGLIGPRTSDAVRAFRQSAGLGNGAAIDQALIDALRTGASL